MHFLFVDLDPARDSQAELAAYFDHRGSNFFSLRPSSNREAAQIAAAYGEALFQRVPGVPTTKAIEHGASIFLIDPEGSLRLRYGGRSLDVMAMAQDWQRLALADGTQNGGNHEAS